MSATTAVAAPREGRIRRRLHRLEPRAVAGVMSRDVTNFKSFWKTTTFSSILDPVIYLLAFGLGFGTLVSVVNGIDYVYFVGTGMVATAVLFSSVFSAMYGVFIKHRFQHTYDAILAAEAANGTLPEGITRAASLEDVFVLLTGEEVE